jgi:hypothetical protein
MNRAKLIEISLNKLKDVKPENMSSFIEQALTDAYFNGHLAGYGEASNSFSLGTVANKAYEKGKKEERKRIEKAIIGRLPALVPPDQVNKINLFLELIKPVFSEEA